MGRVFSLQEGLPCKRLELRGRPWIIPSGKPAETDQNIGSVFISDLQPQLVRFFFLVPENRRVRNALPDREWFAILNGSNCLQRVNPHTARLFLPKQKTACAPVEGNRRFLVFPEQFVVNREVLGC